MTTERKKASNRKNARKSTGPRSLSGKAVVSRNARKHGLLSRHLIVEGESQEEFSELLNLLMEEFQPVGMVEHALVERVGIALWRQRRLVRAESAEVSLNQLRFGDTEKKEIGKVLDMGFGAYSEIRAPWDEFGADEGVLEAKFAYYEEQRKFWQSLLDGNVADAVNPLSRVTAGVRETLLRELQTDVMSAHLSVLKRYGSWADMFKTYVKRFESFLALRRVPEIRSLLMQSRALPTQTDLLSRYQTALDNDLYKALKALRETQAWRQARAMIDVKPLSPDGDSGGK